MRYTMWLLAWIGIILGAFTATAVADASTRSVSYQLATSSGVRVHVITVDMHDAALMVRPAFAYGEPGHGQSFSRFITQHHPLAQISGSYFSLGSWLPIGDVVINGEVQYIGVIGSALAVRQDNTVDIIDVPRGWHAPWNGYEAVLRGGLRLLRQGEYAITARRQGFRDPALFRPASRTAVGVTPGNHLLLVATSAGISLSKMAAVMKGLDCTDAMTLDGGISTGLAIGDQIILNPGRRLSTVLMVKARPTPPPRPVAKAPPAMPTAFQASRMERGVLRRAEVAPAWPAVGTDAAELPTALLPTVDLQMGSELRKGMKHGPPRFSGMQYRRLHAYQTVCSIPPSTASVTPVR